MSQLEMTGNGSRPSQTMLDRAIQIRWTLVIVSLALAADCALGYFRGYGLLAFDPIASASAPPILVGNYLFFCVAYIIGIAGIIAMMRSMIAAAIGEPIYNLIKPAPKSDAAIATEKAQWALGMVKLQDAEKDALIGKDAFWTFRLEGLKAEYKRAQDDRHLLAQFSLACTCLLVANYSISAPDGIVTATTIWLGSLTVFSLLAGKVLTGTALLVLVGPSLPTFFMPMQSELTWVHHPALAHRKYAAMRQKETELERPAG